MAPTGSAELRACAEAANVYAKLSGLNTALARPDWTADDSSAAADRASTRSGPSGSMCGSDWPVALLNGDYDRVWQTTRQVVGRGARARAGAPRRGRCRVRREPDYDACKEDAWPHR